MSELNIEYVTICIIYLTIANMRVTPPSPLAYCVPLYFGIAYCVPPFFGLTYCVPFYKKTHTILAVSIYIKKIKLQYIVCTCTLILENTRFDVFAC